MKWLFIACSVATFLYVCGAVNKNNKIVIVGAGPAGIAAATKLYNDFGFTNIEILEAESYIGGYIHTQVIDTPNGREHVELGDQWIIYGNLHETKLQDITNGSELTLQQVNATNEFLLSLFMFITEKAYPPQLAPNELLQLSAYVTQFLENSVNSSTTYASLANVQEVINRFYENFILAYSPIGDWKELSYKSFAKWMDNGGMLHYLSGGLSTLFNLTTQATLFSTPSSLTNFNVQLNTEVVNIDYSGDDDVVITTGDGRTRTAKKVIVTIPLGALKQQYSTLFTPALSESKIRAIQNLNVSYQESVLLEFDEPWWPEHFSYYQLWSNRDYKNLAGGREWLGTLLGYSIVDYNPKILVAYFKGPNARQLKDVSDATLKLEVLQLLRSSLKNKFTVPEPVKFYRTNWSGNSHFGGGYSYKGGVAKANRSNNLSINSRLANKVYFAGEYTADRGWGTLEAEIRTGISIARMVNCITQYNLLCKRGQTPF